MKIEVPAVNGSKAAALIGGRVRVSYALGTSCPITTVDLPAPPGRVVALDPRGPSALTDDGRVWLWNIVDRRWDRTADLSQVTQ